jgi:large repetitive protein
MVKLRTHRTRTRFAAAGTAVAAFLATLAALIGATVAPASAVSNGSTTYEADCTTSLSAGVVAPFVQGLGANTSTDTLFPTGQTFGVSGTATETIIGPVLAGIEQQLPSANIGAALTETVGSTDGTATGSFTYTHTFPQVPALGRQITGVSWTSGSTSLTAAAGAFLQSDVGSFVAGPSGGGINPQSMITAVNGTGDTATISIATTAAAGPVSVGTGNNMTFADPTFATGNVFTTSGVNGGKANIGVIGVTSVTVNALISIPFGGAQGVGTANCLETGFDAANNPGPAQTGELTPALPPGTVTPLVAASGGFITQPGTAQAITPPAAAFVNLIDAGPVTSDASATIDRNVSNTTTLTLPATDTDPTGVASCSAGSPSDPRLAVSISNSPTPCVATLTDSGGASTGATVTFPFTAVDTAGNPSTPAGGSTVTVTITPIPHVAITTSSLPNAQEGQPYSATLAATGGTTPYTWSATGLPANLAVDPSTGVISGTPAAGTAGTYSIGVTVTDSDVTPETATATLSLTVVPPPVNDGSLAAVVHGPVRSAVTSKSFAGKVTNTGTNTFTVCDTDISWVVTVNAAPTGTVSSTTPGCVSLAPGGSTSFKYSWSYDSSVAKGNTVVFTGTLSVAGDPTPTDNTSSVTKIAH